MTWQVTGSTLEAMADTDAAAARQYRADVDTAAAAAGTMDAELSRLRTRMMQAKQEAVDAAAASDHLRKNTRARALLNTRQLEAARGGGVVEPPEAQPHSRSSVAAGTASSSRGKPAASEHTNRNYVRGGVSPQPTHSAAAHAQRHRDAQVRRCSCLSSPSQHSCGEA